MILSLLRNTDAEILWHPSYQPKCLVTAYDVTSEGWTEHTEAEGSYNEVTTAYTTTKVTLPQLAIATNTQTNRHKTNKRTKPESNDEINILQPGRACDWIG
ncbi:hypothetical protein RRG08_033460 [Elysia crispata]|uniref:Uncharacterized protein n=1 Tax=Elysia crispata TaxID=231223 RepID=A0AAE1ATX9_9GAST|nr:hypothetical protein RRG08_033460 [Elysia crispata]